MNATQSVTPAQPGAPGAGASAKEIAEYLDARCPVNYVWRYESTRADLRALYEKAKQEQWDGRTYLKWDTQVDPQAENFPDQQIPIYGSHLWNKLSAKNIAELRQNQMSWTLSQFLHGEQGALLATAQIVTTVPMTDAKFYASTQVMDEARHVEVYDRYLREKIDMVFPINVHLRSLLDQILSDSRWDMKYLGMQILVEGLAMAAFKFLHTFAREPLVKELVHNVMRDEARHVAFGVMSLKDFYLSELSETERREREEFIYEACKLMRDRFLAKEVWENMGMPVEECLEMAMNSPAMIEFRRLLFMRIVPNIKRLGLLTPFLRDRFTELGILQFEDMPADA
jgi:hypothetical protein